MTPPLIQPASGSSGCGCAGLDARLRKEVMANDGAEELFHEARWSAPCNEGHLVTRVWYTELAVLSSGLVATRTKGIATSS